jgi:hypothetical protein
MISFPLIDVMFSNGAFTGKDGHPADVVEASLLVLKSNPLQDFSAVQQISIRIKQGQTLQIDSDQKA